MKNLKHKSLTTMKNLPEELLLNILLRLPVKSLLRFKSVSKRWRSLISDPGFADSHFQRSSLLPERLLHISGSQARSIDFNSSLYDDSAVDQLHFPNIPTPLDIWGSCRGFVLLDDTHNFIVWNPSTGSYKRLPYFPMPSKSEPFIYGFGYDAFNDDYLIFLAAYDPYNGPLESDLGLFSLKANSWKKFEEGTNFPYLNPIFVPRAGWFLNGAIHWVVQSRGDQIILAFNVTERSFMEIPLADNLEGGYFEFRHLGTLGGCLSLADVDEYTINIWFMKEYGMKSSWTKSIVFSLVNIPSDIFFRPLALTQSGEIVASDCRPGLVKCNDKGELLEVRAYSDSGYEKVTYTETLFSLPCVNEEVREEDRQQ